MPLSDRLQISARARQTLDRSRGIFLRDSGLRELLDRLSKADTTVTGTKRHTESVTIQTFSS